MAMVLAETAMMMLKKPKSEKGKEKLLPHTRDYSATAPSQGGTGVKYFILGKKMKDIGIIHMPLQMGLRVSNVQLNQGAGE